MSLFPTDVETAFYFDNGISDEADATILTGVATWEREIMLERQREGIAKAKAEGEYKGRKPTVGLQVEVRRHGTGQDRPPVGRGP